MASKIEKKGSGKPAAKKIAQGKDPRGEGKDVTGSGTQTETHEHLAAPDKRRRLADVDADKGAPIPAAAPAKDTTVTVRIPRSFNLLVLDGNGSRTIRYESGIGEMPRSHAEHQYSADNGVEIVD